MGTESFSLANLTGIQANKSASDGKKRFVNIRQKLHCTNNIVFWMCIYPESRNELKLTHFLQQLPFILEESSIMPWEKKKKQPSMLDLHIKGP